MNDYQIAELEREINAEREAFESRDAIARDLASSAYHMAIDQGESLDSHVENAIETAIEKGINCDAVTAWFWRYVDGSAK